MSRSNQIAKQHRQIMRGVGNYIPVGVKTHMSVDHRCRFCNKWLSMKLINAYGMYCCLKHKEADAA